MMEYNTDRKQLPITDYGRNIYKMIEYAKTLPDREQRTDMAKQIVEVMAAVNPKSKERTDYRRTLWDHLMILSNHELDVENPYPKEETDGIEVGLAPLRYSDNNIHYRHYGKTLESVIATVSEMEADETRDILVGQIANTMKREYLQWNRDTVDNSIIAKQLYELSQGRLTIPEDFIFSDAYLSNAREASDMNRKDVKGERKKKKQHKKQQ